MNQPKKTNWTILIFMIINHLVAFVGTTLLYCFTRVSGYTWVLFVAMWALSGLSITAGYHRLFSHKSYEATKIVKLFFCLFGAANYQGSVVEWSADHRMHHRYTDTPKDPYSIKQGFWHAHMNWLFTLDGEKRAFDLVPDLQADPIVHWQHRYISILMAFFGFIFPMLIACCWGDPLGGLIVAGSLRMVFGHHMTWAINSVCHMFGKNHYNDQSARDNPLTALFTWGEGFHNFHHKFPIDYRNGIRWFHYDPTKWLIRLLHFFKLANHLKKVDQCKIIQYRVRFQKELVFAKIESSAKDLTESLYDLYQKYFDQIQEKIEHIKSLQTSIDDIKSQKNNSRKNLAYRKTIKEYERLLKNYWKDLKKELGIWKYLIKIPLPQRQTAAAGC